jgi:hypothetical protein
MMPILVVTHWKLTFTVFLQAATLKRMSAEAKASLKAFWAGGRLQLLCIAIVEKFLPLNVRPSYGHSRLPRMISVVLECAGHGRQSSMLTT